MGGACSANVKVKDAYKILVRITEGKRQFGRARCRLEDKCILRNRL